MVSKPKTPLPWSFARRIMSRIRVLDSGCWEWKGAKTADGYGKIEVGGKSWKVHRYIWTCLIGEIPPGHELDHLPEVCTTRACGRPEHMEPVTRADHLRRQWDRVRAAKG